MLRVGALALAAAGRVAAAAHGGIGLHFVHARNSELDPQRLAVEDQGADCVGESLRDIGTVDETERCRLPLCARRRIAFCDSPAAIFESHLWSPRPPD